MEYTRKIQAPPDAEGLVLLAPFFNNNYLNCF